MTIAAMLVLAAGPSSALADVMSGNPADPLDPWIFDFDENGNGSINVNGTGFVPLVGHMEPDPTGVVPFALTYHLPELVACGDARIWEDDTRTIVSDVLRFTNAIGTLTGACDRMIFFSDVGDADLADVGIPANFFGNDGGGVVENGVEGDFRDFNYGSVNLYHGISDVPEPSTLALLALGGFAMIRRRLG
jgi:hypothetical protein